MKTDEVKQKFRNVFISITTTEVISEVITTVFDLNYNKDNYK